MRIAVMAAGAVGGYFGGRMAAAGHDVAFIARGAHRDAIRRDGLKIESALGDLHLKDVNVTDDPRQVGPVDVVLFAVKLWDTETAGEQTRPLLGPESRVITLQNGVDSVERLAGQAWNPCVVQSSSDISGLPRIKTQRGAYRARLRRPKELTFAVSGRLHHQPRRL